MTGRTLLWGAVLAAAALLGATTGCGSACVDAGGRVRVEVQATGDLNDAGAGPQHVRFQVWAVEDSAMYENASADALAQGRTLQDEGMGKLFATDSAWIKPGERRQLSVSIDREAQYSHVAIAVAYPGAKKLLVPLDCGEHAGYRKEDATHIVSFVLGKDAISLAAGE